MDAGAWMQVGGPAGLASALAAGFLFSFTPVAFAGIPLVLAYVTRARQPKEAIAYAGALVTGLALTHMVLGIAAASGGNLARQALGPQWGAVLGLVLVILGVMWTGWLRLPLPRISLRGRRVATLWGAFAIGIPLTIGFCPACSPGLWVVLGVSAALASPVYGALLLFAFAVGRGIPLLVGAASLGLLENGRGLQTWHRGFEMVGGITLLGVGLFLLNQHFFWI